ncbi:MAG: hypothetical protein RLZZ344_1307 [Pseudomonadota bacterium]|jgi:FixJ family two-component response regulator
MQKTIVLLDDDLGVRLAISRALEFAGFHVGAFSTVPSHAGAGGLVEWGGE